MLYALLKAQVISKCSWVQIESLVKAKVKAKREKPVTPHMLLEELKNKIVDSRNQFENTIYEKEFHFYVKYN